MSTRRGGPQLLQEYVGVCRSRMGEVVPGHQAIFRGHDLHAELRDMTWPELYVFGITGRRFSAGSLELLDAMWTFTSYPDVRLWNNRVAGLSGSARSTGSLGLSAAMAVSEAAIYGNGIIARGMAFFLRTQARLESGGELAGCIREELAAHRSVAGFGRPLVNRDERIQPILDVAERHGLADGPHLRLAFAVEEWLLAEGHERMRINYAGVVCALGADMGFTAQEFYLFSAPCFLAGMPPCYIEAREQPEGSLYALPCSLIEYEGPAPRPWPTGAATGPENERVSRGSREDAQVP